MTAWTAVVPVKAWSSAKSRLGVPGDVRAELAQALTLDTLDVLTSHPSIAHVIVVTADDSVGEEARSRGCDVLVEVPAADPLNDAVRQGCASVTGDGPTVVIPADLAYLSTSVLEATLDVLAALGKAHVPDLAGTGTTLLAASSASEIEPHYGVGSSALHSEAGFARLESVDPRARADIDALGDLAHDPTWVPGPRVTEILARLERAVG